MQNKGVYSMTSRALHRASDVSKGVAATLVMLSKLCIDSKKQLNKGFVIFPRRGLAVRMNTGVF